METSDPAAAVRALLEADSKGEDPSRYATGELARLLRLEFEVEQHAEIAARTLTIRRAQTLRDDGRSAVVAIDAEVRLAARQRDGTWKAQTGRIRGRATVVRVDGEWKVSDYPLPRRSRLRSLLPIGDATAAGDLELELIVYDLRKWTSHVFAVRNRGSAPITVNAFDVEAPVMPGVPMTLSTPFLDRRVLEPGAAWASAVRWHGPYRPRRGAVAIRAVDAGGREHRARVAFASARKPGLRWRLARAVTAPRVLELLAAVLAVLALRATWVVWLAGSTLLLAGVIRGAYVGGYLLSGSRGKGFSVALGLVSAEIVVGTAAMFWQDPSWNTVALWAGLFAYLPVVVHHSWAALKRQGPTAPPA